jgi:rhamnosyltransferase
MISKTAVIKVLYNVNSIDYDEVKKMTSCFKHLIIVNNSDYSLENEAIDIVNFSLYNNYNKYGLAGAYNYGISKLIDIFPDYILFLDDDTATDQLYSLYDEKYYSYFNNNLVAAISPIYIDSNSMTRGSHILLNKFSFRRIHRNHEGVSEVSFMINSGSIWKYDSIKQIGKFDEIMKIDHIDTDYCLRASVLGYKLILNSNYRFYHTIGNRLTYKLITKNLRSGNHSPSRRELIIRNSILVLRKHFWKFPVFGYVILERIAYEFIGIIMVEKNKFQKLKSSFKGLFIGIFTKKSEIRNNL